MNYADLSAAIQAFMENTFPATDTYSAAGSVSSKTQIDLFIQQAERKIYNSVQFPSLRKNVEGFTSAGNKYLSTPNDFLAPYSLSVTDATGRYEFLLNKDVSFIRQAYPNPASMGLPRYYALFGPTTQGSNPPVPTNELSLLLGPTPDAAYAVELHYFYYPTSIVDAGTTWLGDNFDTVLLNAALVEAATFMKAEEDLMKVYALRYQEALAMAKRLGDGMERQDAYRSGQYRQQVT